MSVLQTLHTVS